MRKRIEVGVLGATGMVGQQFINQLAGHPWFELKWLAASERSEGKRYADAAPWRLDTGTGPDLHLGHDTSDCLAIVGRDDVVVDKGVANRVIRK